MEPVIGPLGVRALYDRSLHLAGASHAWLADSRGPDPARLDPAALRSTLARQTPADAARGGALLLQTFHDLLTSLIGSSLSGRLLRTVWVRFLSQDTPP
ncbi:MAG: hypothetical protein H7Z19_14080 [Chitinophagaceae bacterium]|nr:hypothetical protein [Rubrivivax sp.]